MLKRGVISWLLQQNLPQTLSIQHSSVQSGLGRLAYIAAYCGTVRFQQNLVSAFHAVGGHVCSAYQERLFFASAIGFFILNSFKASNEATMVNITEEKVNKDSPSSQNILALSTKSFREVTRYTVLCFCCLLS